MHLKAFGIRQGVYDGGWGSSCIPGISFKASSSGDGDLTRGVEYVGSTFKPLICTNSSACMASIGQEYTAFFVNSTLGVCLVQQDFHYSPYHKLDWLRILQHCYFWFDSFGLLARVTCDEDHRGIVENESNQDEKRGRIGGWKLRKEKKRTTERLKRETSGLTWRCEGMYHGRQDWNLSWHLLSSQQSTKTG